MTGHSLLRPMGLFLCLVVGLGVSFWWSGSAAAEPTLQFPWPSGVQHNINYGATYNCYRHIRPTADNPPRNDNANYYAVDFALNYETVTASAAGTVRFAGADSGDGYGNKVEIDHPGPGTGSYFTMYAHLNYWLVNPGDSVSQGQVIGLSGESGGDYDPHLHFQMQRGLNAYPPEPMSGGVDDFGHWGFCTSHPVSDSWPSKPPIVLNLLLNRSFEDTTSCSGTAFKWQKYPTPPVSCGMYVYPPAAHGLNYLSFSSSTSGGSIYQDVLDVNPGPGDSYAFSVWARSVDSGCVSFTVVLYGWGITNPSESQQTNTQVCGMTWQLFSAPLDVQSANYHLRAQIYVGSPNRFLDVDATELIQLMTKKSSFENSDSLGGVWKLLDSANYARQCTPTISNPYSGSCILNLWKAGTYGSIYQDVFTVPSPGQTYTFWIRGRLGGSYPTTTGVLKIFALPNSDCASATLPFTLTSSWQLVPSTGLTWTIPSCGNGRTALRVQVYIDNSNRYYHFDGAMFWKAN